jgi:CRISPR-associated endonuclease/helicase Cas3
MLDEIFSTVLGEGARANRWQQRLFDEFVAGRIPEVVKVPTSGGKTAIILVFLAALAEQARCGPVTLPRRLVIVVNRRALVDQATSLAERVFQAGREGRLGTIATALSTLSASQRPLAVSTLRGELADNGEWSLDPTTPAIILGTPDMIGSRLLFRGYGNGKVKRAQQAGLLGVDTLLVHDEAHLSPIFGALIREIVDEAASSAAAVGRPPFSILEMTATTNHPRPFDGTPQEGDDLDQDLLRRLKARKCLRRITLPGKPPQTAVQREKDKWEAKQREQAVSMIAEKSAKLKQSGEAIAIFFDKPDHVGIVANHLTAQGVPCDRIAVLTGTMRGHERDAVAKSRTFSRFLHGDSGDETVFLICTSAGEIGLDVDADRIFCDLVTLDRLIQRFGRGNRRGVHDDCPIVLVDWESSDAKLEATRQMLSTLPGKGSDASPLALSQLMTDIEGYECATPNLPRRRRLERPIMEMWAMTSLSLNDSSQPEIFHIPEPDTFIHGLDERDLDVQLVWRYLPTSRFEEWLDVWPIQRQEIASLPIGRARNLFAGADGVCLLVAPDGDAVQSVPISSLERVLRPGNTIVLPVSSGGLDEFGLPTLGDSGDRPVEDVSGKTGSLKVTVERVDHGELAPMWEISQLGIEAETLDEVIELLTDRHGVTLAFADPDMSRTPEESSIQPSRVVLWLSPKAMPLDDSGDTASIGRCDRELDEHLRLAATAAERIVHSLVNRELAYAVVEAARMHDLGKAERRWQEAIANPNPERPLAKRKTTHFDQRRNDGYRHELGSLVRAPGITELTSHLIAAHHGWARPVFSDKAKRKPGCQQPGDAAMLTFARLQARYGLWGLAYLEALVRCADVHAELLAEQLGGTNADQG